GADREAGPRAAGAGHRERANPAAVGRPRRRAHHGGAGRLPRADPRRGLVRPQQVSWSTTLRVAFPFHSAHYIRTDGAGSFLRRTAPDLPPGAHSEAMSSLGLLF